MGRTLAAGLALVLAAAAQAQPFPIPGKPVRIVLPFAPGGQTDIPPRAIAQKRAEAAGLQAIVENKPGAATLTGAREVQKAAPDGLTLLYPIATQVQVPHLSRVPPGDPFRDFTPITAGARSATVLTAHASVPFHDVPGPVASAKAHPGKLHFAPFRPGSTSHLKGERFERLAGIDLVHVPSKGSGDAMKDLLSRVVQLFSDGPATVEAAHAALARAIRHPGVVELFAEGGAEVSAMPPAEMMRVARERHDKGGEVIRELGVRLDS